MSLPFPYSRPLLLLFPYRVLLSACVLFSLFTCLLSPCLATGRRLFQEFKNGWQVARPQP